MQDAKTTFEEAAMERLAEFFAIEPGEDPDDTRTGSSDFIATLGFPYTDAIDARSPNYLLDKIIDAYAFRVCRPSCTDPYWEAAIQFVILREEIEQLERDTKK